MRKFVHIFIIGFCLLMIDFGRYDLDKMEERESWTPATGVVIGTDFEIYENPDFDPKEDSESQRYRGREYVYYEYYREDGRLCTGEYTREDLSTSYNDPTEIGKEFDMLYDPDSDESYHRLQTKSDYIFNYASIIIPGIVLFVYAFIGIRMLYRRTKYDSGLGWRRRGR